MDTNSSSCHEAGHTVVALSLGFQVMGIDVFEGRFRTACDLDSTNWTDMDRFIFLAGGIAGEKVGVGDYDRVGCGDDQDKITKRGGKSIETYLPAATRIIESNKECFQELTKKIRSKIFEKLFKRSMFGGGNSFMLVSGDVIQQLWKEKARA